MMKIIRMNENATLPTKHHIGDLGYDLYASEQVRILSGKFVLISTGIRIEFPEGYGAFIKDRSSVSSKKGLFVHAGVIDNGYTGEIKILIHNADLVDHTIYIGDKIAQLVPIEFTNFDIVEVKSFEKETTRGDGGFGSTN